MPKHQRKAQVLFTEDQYARLLEIAKREGKKLGALVQDACRMHALGNPHLTKKWVMTL